MSTSDIRICNLALGALGTRSRIVSLTENTEEARQCALWYEQTRDALLQGTDWNFCRKRVVLSRLDAASDVWAYVYAYPSRCLQLRFLQTASRTDDKPPYEVALAEVNGTDVPAVMSDVAEAVAVYTAAVTDPNLFRPLFVRALAWTLAANISHAITSGAVDPKSALQMAQYHLAAAQAADANEACHDDQPEATWIRGR